MTLALTKLQTSYNDHEAAYLAELRPHGVLEVKAAKTIAGLAWQIEEIDRLVSQEIERAKKEIVNEQLLEYAGRNLSLMPIGGKSAYQQAKARLKGLSAWERIVRGEDLVVNGEMMTAAYIGLCDWSGFDFEGELDPMLDDFIEVLKVPSEDGTIGIYLSDHEKQRLNDEWTLSKVRYVNAHLSEYVKAKGLTVDMILFTRSYLLEEIEKYKSWQGMISDKRDELEKKPLPFEQMQKIQEQARRSKRQLSDDLDTELKRLTLLQVSKAPSVTIEHALLLDNLSL